MTGYMGPRYLQLDAMVIVALSFGTQPYKTPRTKLAFAHLNDRQPSWQDKRYDKGVEWIELVTMTIADPSLLGQSVGFTRGVVGLGVLRGTFTRHRNRRCYQLELRKGEGKEIPISV